MPNAQTNPLNHFDSFWKMAKCLTQPKFPLCSAWFLCLAWPGFEGIFNKLFSKFLQPIPTNQCHVKCLKLAQSLNKIDNFWIQIKSCFHFAGVTEERSDKFNDMYYQKPTWFARKYVYHDTQVRIKKEMIRNINIGVIIGYLVFMSRHHHSCQDNYKVEI